MIRMFCIGAIALPLFSCASVPDVETYSPSRYQQLQEQRPSAFVPTGAGMPGEFTVAARASR